MRRISLIVVAFVAFLASCSSPYYPEYVPIISLGSQTESLVCENDEGVVSLNVLSNVDYTATLLDGRDWLNFTDTDLFVREGSGNDILEFRHIANNHDKRVAHLELASGDRKQIIKIKQKGYFEDYLEIHPEDKTNYLPDNRMIVRSMGAAPVIRLKTSCLDHQITCKSDIADAISDMKVENKVLSFTVNQNNDGQPRLITIELSYVDGWEDVKTMSFTIYQGYND